MDNVVVLVFFFAALSFSFFRERSASPSFFDLLLLSFFPSRELFLIPPTDDPLVLIRCLEDFDVVDTGLPNPSVGGAEVGENASFGKNPSLSTKISLLLLAGAAFPESNAGHPSVALFTPQSRLFGCFFFGTLPALPEPDVAEVEGVRIGSVPSKSISATSCAARPNFFPFLKGNLSLPFLPLLPPLPALPSPAILGNSIGVCCDGVGEFGGNISCCCCAVYHLIS